MHFSAIAKMRRRGELTTERRRGAALDRAEVEALAEHRRLRREEIKSRAVKRRPVDPRPDTEHEWLSPKDVAEMFGISRQGVALRLRKGTMKGVRHRNKWWLRSDQLEHMPRGPG